MNILYINPLADEIICIIHTPLETRTHRHQKGLTLSEVFPGFLTNLCSKYSIDEVWCITGPGPFTLMRIVTLTINTLAYQSDIRLKGCSFFDLLSGLSSHIPLLTANTNQYTIFKDGVLDIQKSELPPGEYIGYADFFDSTGERKLVHYEESWDAIESYFIGLPHIERLTPLYIKPPHITCPKS